MLTIGILERKIDMKKPKLLVLTSLVLALLVSLLAGGCAPAGTGKLTIVTNTSLLTYIVRQVGGDQVDIVELVPPSQHPGNFDAKPGDIQKLAGADFFFVHGWPGETYVPRLVAAANNPNLKLVTISVEGSWMTPEVQLAATDKVAATLSEADTQNSKTYQQHAAAYKDRVTAKEARIKARLAEANLASIKAIGAFWQADFIKWTGINLIATYNDAPDSLTPPVVKDLVDKGKAANVTLIIQNLQSGPEAGKAMAEELGVRRITLSNFPGGFNNTETWEKAIDYNIELILAAVTK